MDNRLRLFWEAICDELLFAHALLDVDTPFNRRTFVRTSFAVIEGVTFFLKSYSLDRLRTTGSPAEISMLKEEVFSLDNSGNIQIQQRFIPLESNIRFAFTMYGRALGREIKLDCSGREWQAFKTAVSARNRIVHPRSTGDLSITDEELACTTMATRWLLMTLVLNALDRVEELSSEHRRLKEQLDDALPERESSG